MKKMALLFIIIMVPYNLYAKECNYEVNINNSLIFKDNLEIVYCDCYGCETLEIHKTEVKTDKVNVWMTDVLNKREKMGKNEKTNKNQ